MSRVPATTRCRTPLKSATRQPGPSAVLAKSPSPAASLARDGATYTCRTWPGGGEGGLEAALTSYGSLTSGDREMQREPAGW